MLLVSACGVLEKVLFSVSLEEFVGATNDDVEEVRVPLFEVTVVSVVVVALAMNPVAEVVVAPDDEVKVMIVGVLVVVVDVVGVVGFRVLVVVASVGSIFKVVVVDVLGGPECMLLLNFFMII